MSTQPIATYTERLLEVQRAFALHADRVVVSARWYVFRRFEHVVPLAALKPESQQICFVQSGRYGEYVERLRPGAARPESRCSARALCLGRR